MYKKLFMCAKSPKEILQFSCDLCRLLSTFLQKNRFFEIRKISKFNISFEWSLTYWMFKIACLPFQNGL